jgi:hypothetical protein
MAAPSNSMGNWDSIYCELPAGRADIPIICKMAARVLSASFGASSIKY